MSDSERSDVDARFAEIIAHWDDIELTSTADPPADTLPADTLPPDTLPPETLPPDTLPPGTPSPEAGPPEADPSEADLAGPAAPAQRSPLPGPHGHGGTADVGPGTTPPSPGDPPDAWRGQPTPEAEEHFEPASTAPLPAGDLQFWGIVLGLCGGPLLLLYLVVFDRDAGSLWTATAILLTLGGFGLLVARQPHRRADDGDDGARL